MLPEHTTSFGVVQTAIKLNNFHVVSRTHRIMHSTLTKQSAAQRIQRHWRAMQVRVLALRLVHGGEDVPGREWLAGHPPMRPNSVPISERDSDPELDDWYP